MVHLPSGEEIAGFDKFEVGQAFVKQIPKGKLPMELCFDPPTESQLNLPEALDLDTDFSLDSCGEFLEAPEVAKLVSKGNDAEKCSICLCEMTSDDSLASGASGSSGDAMEVDGGSETPVFELKCGHAYHTDCLRQWFQQRKRCPQCQQDFGKVMGAQPRTGSMRWFLEDFSLPGHPEAKQTIVVQFDFPPGQDESGRQYDGRKPKGYLPCNAQGIVLLELFKLAFRRCVMFGMGTSLTYDTYRPTFNIHIKTSTRRGQAGHGYPDDSYFERAMDELRSNGVFIANLPE